MTSKFSVLHMKIVPKCHPEGLAELSLGKKLTDLEGKLKVFVDTLVDIKSDAVHNCQKITALESGSKLHGQLIQQMIVKTNGRNAENTTLTEAVAGGSSTQQKQQRGGNIRGVALASNDSSQGERQSQRPSLLAQGLECE